MCIKVIGIDPAPSKNSTVYSKEDGFMSFDANELKEYLDDQNAPVLICWDAPLTGPRDPDAEQMQQGDYSQRDIESFFMSPRNGKKTPKGISVMGYSGCPHWTITRGLLGLPRVGRYDTPWEDLPFQLLASEEQKADFLKTQGKGVVEVHPAVALWLWLANTDDHYKDYHYKKDLSILKDFYSSIRKMFPNYNLPENIANDDKLDALVAWLLGKLWINEDEYEAVTLLGSKATGAMLLPNINGLQEKWNKFINRSRS